MRSCEFSDAHEFTFSGTEFIVWRLIAYPKLGDQADCFICPRVLCIHLVALLSLEVHT